MNLLERVTPEWSLRLGLGAMYLYSGIDLMLHPRAWHWALPYWLRQVMESAVGVDNYLRVQGGGEVILALVLLAPFVSRRVVKWAAALSALEMLGILILAFLPWSANNFLTTFRDLGLLGASGALFLLLRLDSRELSPGSPGRI